jgi:L-asparaginase
MSKDKPPVAIGALGGTISMATPRNSKMGAVPALDVEALLDVVPGLSDIVDCRVKNISMTSSASLRFEDLLDALAFAHEQTDIGVSGIVLTQGTDVLEESAYFLDLLWDRPEPIVFTGAMNTESSVVLDGPQNIIDSVRAATSNSARGVGVMVCMDGKVHLAHTVTKTNSSALSTFRSPDWGPFAQVVEKRLHVAWKPAHRRTTLAVPRRPFAPCIPIIETGLGDCGLVFESLLKSRIDGLVIAAPGAGHLSAHSVDVVQEIVRSGIPVVFSTHTGSGSTFHSTYGYEGGEMDLIRRGLIPAGFLTPQRARILLAILAINGADHSVMRRIFRLEGDW